MTNVFDFFCYHIWMHLPIRAQASIVGMWALAYAGRYAYEED
jgi:hypothetical protein